MTSLAQIDRERRDLGLSPPVIVNTDGLLRMDLSRGAVHRFQLTANVFVTTPFNGQPSVGDRLIVTMQQDSAGSHSVTWGVCFRDPPAWSPGAAGTVASAAFFWDGQSFQYEGGSSAFATSGLALVPQTGSMGLASDASPTQVNPAPTAGAVALAGVAPTISKPTVTAIAPTAGAVTAAGVAPTAETPLVPGAGSIGLTGLLPTRTP